jgi:hypothetical protein
MKWTEKLNDVVSDIKAVSRSLIISPCTILPHIDLDRLLPIPLRFPSFELNRAGIKVKVKVSARLRGT